MSSYPYDAEYDALLRLVADQDIQLAADNLEGEGFWTAFLEWSHAVQLLLHPLESERRLLWAFWSQDRDGTIRMTTELHDWTPDLFHGGGVLRGYAFLTPEPVPSHIAAAWPARMRQIGRWQRAAALTWEVDTQITEQDGPGIIGHRRFWGRQSPRPWTSSYRRGEGFSHWHGLPTSADPTQSVPVLKDTEWPQEVVRLLEADRPDGAFWAAWRNEWRRFTTQPVRKSLTPRDRASGVWAYAGWGLFALSVLWILAHGGH